jgi:DNA-directed RNA polymerase specialized sigma subunit
LAAIPTQTPEFLWRQYKQKGDKHAREQLIAVCKPFVNTAANRVARKLPPHLRDSDELVSYGFDGLLGAIETFDPSSGSLAAWVTNNAEWAIRDEHRASNWIPRTTVAQQAGVEASEQELQAQLGRTPRGTEIADRLNWSSDKYSRHQADMAQARSVSLDALLTEGSEGSGVTGHDLLVAPSSDRGEFDPVGKVRSVIESLPSPADLPRKELAWKVLGELTDEETKAFAMRTIIADVTRLLCNLKTTNGASLGSKWDNVRARDPGHWLYQVGDVLKPLKDFTQSDAKWMAQRYERRGKKLIARSQRWAQALETMQKHNAETLGAIVAHIDLKSLVEQIKDID